MQIPLYVGTRKLKDKIVSEELLKFNEGNRCDRVKDLILKGLIWEGRTDIPNRVLESKYVEFNPNITNPPHKIEFDMDRVIQDTNNGIQCDDDTKGYSEIPTFIRKSTDDLEDKI